GESARIVEAPFAGREDDPLRVTSRRGTLASEDPRSLEEKNEREERHGSDWNHHRAARDEHRQETLVASERGRRDRAGGGDWREDRLAGGGVVHERRDRLLDRAAGIR